MENKYQKGKIYKIVNDELNLTYYGSTIEPTVAKRLTKHIYHYKHYMDGKGCYITSFKLFENNNYKAFLVENYPCNSKDELLSRERFYIENNECVNKFIPTRTGKEYREAKKEHIKQQKKEYYEDNKEHIKEQGKEYREANKEYIKEKSKEYYGANKEHIKEYRETNKEHKNEYMKEYYEANREHRKKYEKERYRIKKETPTSSELELELVG